uniref:ferroxidase n=1 Tax=Crassostrea virginica TaxID=6565 RepID=A0A8B8DQW4_CRAVI|nr:frataxin, mitochondrial-like [Crassostrea virginica]
MRSKLFSIFRLSHRLFPSKQMEHIASIRQRSCMQFNYPSAQFSTGSVLQNQLSELDYHTVAGETMESLTEKFEDIGDTLPCDPEYDAQYSSGVLTVKISDKFGTYVINKQPSNLQIWLSSPISGPFRYDFEDGAWVYKRTSRTLHQLLSDEVSKALNTPIDFTDCSYGSQESS